MADSKKLSKLKKELARIQAEIDKEEKKQSKVSKVGKSPAKATSKKGSTTVKKKSKKLTGKVNVDVKESVEPKYSMLKEIKSSPFYGKTNRDPIARDWILDNCPKYPKNRFLQGQLILFKYLNPKYKEELEYYDASPCTIFFNVVNTKEGKRVLGFNIHYYPPQMRYQILHKIFELYRGVYTKYFKNFNKKEIDGFDYKILIQQLSKANLEFGVRMYIPQLIGEPYIITPNKWQVAVFTEGWFKKQTRTQIMSFWKKWTPSKSKKKLAKAAAPKKASSKKTKK